MDKLGNQLTLSSTPENFKAHILFQGLEAIMQSDETNLIENARGIYGIKIINGPKGEGGYWVINAKSGRGFIEYNGKDKTDVTFTIDDNDIQDLMTGKLNPQAAFFQGKVKIQGNLGLAIKLLNLQTLAKDIIEDFRSKL